MHCYSLCECVLVPSPSIFAYCKWYKYWGGNHLDLLTCVIVYWMWAYTGGDMRKGTHTSHHKQDWTEFVMAPSLVCTKLVECRTLWGEPEWDRASTLHHTQWAMHGSRTVATIRELRWLYTWTAEAPSDVMSWELTSLVPRPDPPEAWVNTHRAAACTWHMHNTGAVSLATAQSSRYVHVTHCLYGCAAHWQYIMCSAMHMGYDVHM